MRQALKDHVPRADHLQVLESRLQAQASQLEDKHSRQQEAAEQQWRTKLSEMEHKLEMERTDFNHKLSNQEQHFVHQLDVRETEMKNSAAEKLKASLFMPCLVRIVGTEETMVLDRELSFYSISCQPTVC
eukprot:scaffold74885_cov28-Prasinocladus_malaysianus.AAC.1